MPPEPLSLIGVIVGVESGGNRQGPRVHPADRRVDPRSSSRSGARERRGIPAGPPRRAPGDSTAGPGLVSDRGRTATSRSVSRTRPEVARQPPAVISGMTASSSSAVIVNLVGATHDPGPIDGEDPRLGQQAPLVRDVGRLEVAVRVQHRLELSVDLLELVRLDVDERDVRVAGGHGLEPVERRSALRAGAELGRGEDEHERLMRRQRVRDRGRVEGRVRVLVGRDLRDVAADVVQRWVCPMRGACSPTRDASASRRGPRRSGGRSRPGRPRRLGRELGAPGPGLRAGRRSRCTCRGRPGSSRRTRRRRCGDRVRVPAEVVERDLRRPVRRARHVVGAVEVEEQDAGPATARHSS